MFLHLGKQSEDTISVCILVTINLGFSKISLGTSLMFINFQLVLYAQCQNLEISALLFMAFYSL